MVRVSRYTESSNVPIPIHIVTNRIDTVITLTGPMSSIDVPGNRIRHIDIPDHHLYGIRIVSDDVEYRYDQCKRLRHVDNIIIFDGFLLSPYPCIPGYTYRPIVNRGDTVTESGLSYLYPPSCI